MALPSEKQAPRYAIRPLEVGDPAEREALFEFVRQAWGTASWHSDRARWHWQFRTFPGADDATPPLLVFARGQEVLGQVGAIPVELCIGDRREPATFAFQIMILPEYWNRGAFPLLMREFCKAYPITMGLGMNDKAYALFQSLEWIHIGIIPRLERYATVRSVLDHRTLAALARQPWSALRRLRPVRTPKDFDVQAVATFDDGVTDVWDRNVGERIGVRRTATWLNWRYGEQPLMSYVRLEMRRTGTLVGCAVVRTETIGDETIGFLVECFGDRDALDGVARAAVARLLESGVDRVTCDLLDPTTEATLNRLGFVYRRSNLRFMLSVVDEGLAGELADRGRWYVTSGDADQDRPS